MLTKSEMEVTAITVNLLIQVIQSFKLMYLQLIITILGSYGEGKSIIISQSLIIYNQLVSKTTEDVKNGIQTRCMHMNLWQKQFLDLL